MKNIDLDKFAVGDKIRLSNKNDIWGTVSGDDIVTVATPPSKTGGFTVYDINGLLVLGCHVNYWSLVSKYVAPIEAGYKRKSSLILDGRFYRGSRSTALRRIGTIVRLSKEGYSVRETAAKLGLSKSAVHRVIQKAA